MSFLKIHFKKASFIVLCVLLVICILMAAYMFLSEVARFSTNFVTGETGGISVVVDENENYYIKIHETNKVNTEGLYEYSGLPQAKALQHSHSMGRDQVLAKTFSKDFILLSYKDGGGVFTQYLKHQIEDQLIELKEDGTAKVLYKSSDHTRIIYGDATQVLVYDAEDNVFRYIDLSKEKVLKEISSKLKTERNSYVCEYKNQHIKIVNGDNQSETIHKLPYNT